MQLVLSVTGILLFISLIVAHEWGHFIAARRAGVEVEEFGLGFPPRAWGRRLKSGMMLSLNWLPLGGFVKLKGEHDGDTEHGSFGKAPLSSKVKIMLAGVFMNLIIGLILLTILALVGMPKLITNEWSGEDQFTVARDTKITHQEVRVGDIRKDSPANQIGLVQRDVINSIDQGAGAQAIKSSEDLHTATTIMAGQTVTINFTHNGQHLSKVTTLLSKDEVKASLKTDNPKGYLGVSPVDLQIRRSTWSAPIVAVGFTAQLTKLTMVGIGHALSGLGSTIAGLVTNNDVARHNGQAKATAQVGGPVAIANILWGSGSLGINFMLMIVAVISLTLAIMNVLPIPALDGGRLFLTLITRFIRRPLSPLTEDRVHGAGMLVLMVLFLLITIVDVRRFF